MFASARIKLTAWYLLMIMIISVAFSTFVYRGFTGELSRGLRLQPVRIISPNSPARILMWDEAAGQVVDPQDVYNDIQHRVLLMLGLLNLGIFGLAGAAGYVLAGKTLAPIEAMLDRQRQFVADASHELKTPLTVLRSQIEVALREKMISGKDAKGLLSSNLEEVTKMQNLTNYLLALSRYQDNGKKINMEVFDLILAINDSIEKHQKALVAKKMKLKLSLSDIQMHGNATSISELISILLDNAIKYSENGKIIKIKTKISKRHVIISISDQGVGIKSSDLPYIFNRFYRADTSRSKVNADGYGLGLAIAKSIVDMHKGKINVTSTPGHGSIFKVILPI